VAALRFGKVEDFSSKDSSTHSTELRTAASFVVPFNDKDSVCVPVEDAVK